MAARVRTPSPYPPWMERPSPLARALKALVLILLAFVMLFPFIYVIAVSFSSYKDVVGGGLILWPAHPTLGAYRAILKGGIVTHALWVSIAVTLVGTAVNMFMTVTLAYGLSRPGVPGSRFVLILVLFTLLFSAGIIPNYLLVRQLGLIDSYGSLILPGMISAFNLIIVRQFFMNLPQELLESARLDGASNIGILMRIILPLSKPVLAVVALFYGVAHWNDFFSATLYLNDGKGNFHLAPAGALLKSRVIEVGWIVQGQDIRLVDLMTGELLPLPWELDDALQAEIAGRQEAQAQALLAEARAHQAEERAERLLEELERLRRELGG